jgi:hypothetical protein
MVKGLEIFAKHFSRYNDQYVLIGGTACSLIMEDAGTDFRATKDLDIVLYIEALSKDFIDAFWSFIKAGKYQNRQRSTGKELFYRFFSPEEREFPIMLELFSRLPDTVQLGGESHLTPLPMHEEVSSLSAILLDDAYYHLIHSGKQQIKGLSVININHLIPLKARAWLDLVSRQNEGVKIDSLDIRKHKNDILRLFLLLELNQPIEIPQAIKEDMVLFLAALSNTEEAQLESMGLKGYTIIEIENALKKKYSISK